MSLPGSPLSSPPTYVRDVEDGLNRAPGQVNGLATLDASGTLTAAQVPASIANGLTFQATWNATTNTPTLPPVSTPDPGDFWVVTTAGATALPGAAGPWTVGQAAVFNGTDWDALDMYPLALGLPVAGASSGDILGVDGSGNLYADAPATVGVQPYSANLDAASAAPTAGDIFAAPGGTPAWSTLSEAGFGTIATQNANSVSISGGSISGITDLAVADGGTGASTAAGARDGIVWASGGAIDPASPYTVAAGVDFVSFASSKTAAPRALANYADGQRILFYNSSTSTITVTITPADGTIDGGASVALSCPAKGVVGCVRLTSSTWGSVQPGTVEVTRIVADISGGAWRAAGYANLAGMWTKVTDYYAPGASQDPESWGYSLSGTDISLTTGAGIVNSSLRDEAPGWSWALSTFGVSLAPGPRPLGIKVTVSSITLTSAAGTDYHGVLGCYSTALDLATGAMYAAGVQKGAPNYGPWGDDANAVPSATATTTTLRSLQAMFLHPLVSGATPYGYRLDSGDGLESAAALAACASSGSATHIGVFFGRAGTPRAGTIAAPVVTFDL